MLVAPILIGKEFKTVAFVARAFVGVRQVLHVEVVSSHQINSR